MNPKYLFLADALQLLTFFIIAPLLAIALAYAAWRGKPQRFTLQRYEVVCVVSGAMAFLLFGFARWMNADIRTAQYFLQLTCVLASGLLFGVFMGCGVSVMLHVWGWHKRTRLMNDK